MRLECEKLEEWVVKGQTPQGDKRFVMSNHFVKGFAVGISKVCDTSSQFCGFRGLLSEVHSGVFTDCSSNDQFDQERSPIRLDGAV